MFRFALIWSKKSGAKTAHAVAEFYNVAIGRCKTTEMVVDNGIVMICWWTFL